MTPEILSESSRNSVRLLPQSLSETPPQTLFRSSQLLSEPSPQVLPEVPRNQKSCQIPLQNPVRDALPRNPETPQKSSQRPP